MMWIDAIWSRKNPPLYTVNLFDWRRIVRFHASRESQKNILVTRCLVCMRTCLFVLLFRVWFPPGQWMLYILVSFVTNSLLFHALSVIPNLPYESFSEKSWPRSKTNSLSIAKPLTATISIHPISFRSGQNLPWNPSYSLSIYTLYSCIDVWRLLTSWTNRLVIPSRILFKTFVMCKSEPIKFIPRDNNTYNSQHVIP